MDKNMRFTFSDTIAGYVTSFDWDRGIVKLHTSDGREFEVALTRTTYAELVRNFGEPYADATSQMRDMLNEGRYLYAYGTFYPQGDSYKFEAKHIVFLGREDGDYRFEEPDWWVHEMIGLGDFYLRSEFPDGNIDYRDYRTVLTREGYKTSDRRQETDTISRLVYGFATGYLMTGDDRYLEAAERGTEYLRDHMRFVDHNENIVYWYHGIDVENGHERKILASEFGDDYDAIPAYEQIYALAGPTQTFRITGDPRIRSDIEMTVNLFEKYFLDHERGGYFSHLDPVTFDARSEALSSDRARKNWNSNGDHAPAYLINAWLATGEQRYADMLQYCADVITEHFPDYEHSPFVQERFHEDWTHDQSWGWQQNRAVVGHNLKIAWNLMRINSIRPDERFVALARKIAEIMPDAGSDRQRGGWYDVVERVRADGEEFHRFVWHDRKAWWQQEQAILAYLILAGTLGEGDHRRHAREAAAFYNTWFLDNEEGGVFFNVLANGIPYLMGTERFKGSHSMAGYHAPELCYLACTYTNLLLTGKPMDLYFKPKPGAWPDNILRVSPDILPPGSVKLAQVWINGQRYEDFDADALAVRLPVSSSDLKVRVRVVPSQKPETFQTKLETSPAGAQVTLSGELDAAAAPVFETEIRDIIAAHPKRLIVDVKSLDYISGVGIRALAFAKQKLGAESDLYVVGAHGEVKEALDNADMTEEIILVDQYDPSAMS
jgi:anti-anti-sigma factor